MDVPEIAVRWVHIMAAAAMFGGALLVFVAARWHGGDRAVAEKLALGFERVFWLFAGLSVISGIGNLLRNLAAAAIPIWNDALLAKLALVGAGLLFSLARTLVVARGAPLTGARLQFLYGTTAGGLAAIVFLAEVLAHGI